MNSDVKNQQIRNSIKNTRDRHAAMSCRVYEVKVNASKMNCAQKDAVNTLFKEAKWRRNDIVADLSSADRNAKSATVKVGESFETRVFTILGSQMIQDIYDSVRSEIRGLSTKKEHGEKVGSLKFRPFCNCVPLRQHGNTYRIDFQNDTIRVVNIKKPFRVRGLKQIPEDADIANAKFVRKPDGLYFHITCFVQKTEAVRLDEMCGIDFGIADNLTLSNGDTFNIRVSEDKRIKLASRRLNRSLVKNNSIKSSRHKKRRHRLQIAYQKNTNRKRELANQVLHKITSRYGFIAMQDEMIRNWHSGLFGKQVQSSAMGIIKAELKKNSNTHVVDRSFPSTQICPVCGKNTKHSLKIRCYQCAHCGFYHPSRDVKSAASILIEALRQVSAERRTHSPGEVKSSVVNVPSLAISHKPATREAQVL